MQLEKAKNEDLIENSFTFSLGHVCDKQFMQLILPSIQQHMATRAPCGASWSRCSNLLRNSFSLEVYKEFLKDKTTKHDRKLETKDYEVEQEDVENQLKELIENPRFKPEFLRTQTFRDKMDVMKQGRGERDALRATLTDIKSKLNKNRHYKLDFFKSMEVETKEQ